MTHALVTGGGTGVGKAIALALAVAGHAVTICGRRADVLDDVARGHERIHAETADVTDEASVLALYEKAQAARGPFGIVVANAGAGESAPAHKTSLDLWQKTLDVNLTGSFLTVKPAIEPMKRAKSGRIVFVASIAGLKGAPYVSAYVAAKHGVVGLTRALALELAKSGVTVNAVCPGYVETPMLERTLANIMEKTGRSEAEARADLAGGNPQGRIIEVDEVAAAVLYLVGEGARSVNGQALAICGGETW
ncbi:SDR family NAD(P)-dependent oxidoreductase [Mesorhizobium sp. CAU 1732]|uniref:SDR family NAD(P)-dependent oxidoreductase n=1 Tax=Mesorhizobium sp. CAU 1732 TaxID=3140358 RepID=UPI003260CCE1